MERDLRGVLGLILIVLVAVVVLGSCGRVSASLRWPPAMGSRYDAVFTVTAVCPEGARVGTAFAVGPRLLVTARHVVTCLDDSAATDIQVGRSEEDGGDPVAAQLSFRSQDDDVAALVMRKSVRAWIAISQSEPEVGDQVCAITRQQVTKCGYVCPSGVRGVVAAGIRGVPGNSGSPLLDEHGQVVGVLTRATMGMPGVEDVVEAVAGRAVLEAIRASEAG